MNHKYKYVINDRPNAIPYDNIYTYGSENTVEIRMLKKGISILYSTDEEQNESVFSNAIKKVMLIYIIKCSKPLKIKRISKIMIDDKDYNKKIEWIYRFINKEERYVYSLAEDEFQHKMPEIWQNDKAFIENLLNVYEKNEYQCIISSLSALILSKTKKYESERFVWLWTAVNGMYNFFWNLIKECGKTNNNQETSQICAFAKLNDFKTDFPDKKNKPKIYEDVIEVIYDNWNDDAGNNVTQESLQGIHKNLAEQIKNKLYARYKINKKGEVIKENGTPYDLDAYTYLFLDMAYYYRCNIFHADKPVKLFSFEEEAEIKMLKVLNSIMEDYVERNLAKWFDNTYVNEILRSKAVQIFPEFKNKKKAKNPDEICT